MERLTSPTLKQNFKHCADAWSDDLLRKEYWRLYDRLAAYENTGLTPEEVRQKLDYIAHVEKLNAHTNHDYRQLCSQLAERDKEIDRVLEVHKKEVIVTGEYAQRAIDLEAENTRLREQLAEAVRTIQRNCSSIEHVEGGVPYCAERQCACDGCESKWRGLRKEG